MVANRGVRETLVIEAKAGSGKTTTIERLCGMLSRDDAQNAIALAFNKDIVSEFGARLSHTGVTCKTLNSLGNQALWQHFRKKLDVQGYKYSNIIETYLTNMGLDKSKMYETKSSVNMLLTFAMASLVGFDAATETWSDPSDDALQLLMDKYGIDLPIALSSRDMFNMVRSALNEGETLAREKRLISFDDQIFLPIKWGLAVAKHKFIFVDESQDLSAAKLELSLRAGNGDAKFVFVGDSFQAIYGFAAADVDSMAQIIRKTNATILPLSVCYRCPKSVIAEAQQIVPDIEAAPDAIEGVVREIQDTQLASELQAGDMVLCRVNAPLVKLAVQLIGARVPAKMKGRDIGKNLVTFAKTALGKGEWSDFPRLLEEYSAAQLVLLQGRKNSEGQQETLRDKVLCTETLFDAFHPQSLKEYEIAVNDLFSDSDALIELSSVHRAKGLGRDRVFILKPEKLPLVWKNQQEWQRKQEDNLHYVAITRAKKELIYVRTTKKA
jgi:superfamily I DNA/RNA helicase